MADDGERARALGAWEQALERYREAAAATFRRGALEGPPSASTVDLLEALAWEERQAFTRFVTACREA